MHTRHALCTAITTLAAFIPLLTVAQNPQIRISGEQYVEWASDGTGRSSYANSGVLCVVHRPDCGHVGHNGKDHFFSKKNPLPPGIKVDRVDYTPFWPIGLTKTDRGGIGSMGSYGVDLENPGNNTPPISVHWQNACQASTSNDWEHLPATYQISFVLSGPQAALNQVSQKNASVPASVNPIIACRRADTPGPLPGGVAIESFTASWNGHTETAGKTLVIPVGSKATLAWNVANCGAGCKVNLAAVRGGTSAPSLWAKPVATTGSMPVAPTDMATTYEIGASDTATLQYQPPDIESAKVNVQLTNSGTGPTCSGCQWFYFKLTSPAGAANAECFTFAAYAPNEAAAKTEAQGQATNYTVTPITADQYYQGCGS